MATFFVRMTIYDPEIMAALKLLKRSRKQSAFLVEALRQFLSTEGGQNLLRSMVGFTVEGERGAATYTSKAADPNPAVRTDLDDIFRK